VTWERKSSVRENLFVWNGTNGTEVLRMYYRDFEPDLWYPIVTLQSILNQLMLIYLSIYLCRPNRPLLQWTSDEEVMAHQTGEQVNVLNGHTLDRYNLAFSVPPLSYSLAVFH
jgi:hypothetical protein